MVAYRDQMEEVTDRVHEAITGNYEYENIIAGLVTVLAGQIANTTYPQARERDVIKALRDSVAIMVATNENDMRNIKLDLGS